MTTKRADQLKAGDAFTWTHHEQFRDTEVITRFTHTLDRDAELRPDRFGIDRACLHGTISDPQVIHGGEVLAAGENAPQMAAALTKGEGFMIFGTQIELELAEKPAA